MSYSIDELEQKNDTDYEQVRTRKIFENLKNKAIAGKKLTEHEKNFFCKGVKLSLLDDGNWDDSEVCDNPKFKFLYLVYYRDLAGGSKYYKPFKTNIVQVPIPEAQSDLKYMIQKAEEWKSLIVKSSHSDQLLQQSAKEARNEIKALNNLPEIENDPFAKGKFKYRYKKWAILLQSKYLFHLAQEILETNSNRPFVLIIGGHNIELNEFSIIHILNRHYSQITKQFDSRKSFHSEDFKPRFLGNELQDIFNRIEHHLSNEFDPSKIVFDFNNQTYEIWTSIEVKGVKGKGMVKYRRLNTFYPVTDKTELDKIYRDYKKSKIDEEISFWNKKAI